MRRRPQVGGGGQAGRVAAAAAVAAEAVERSHRRDARVALLADAAVAAAAAAAARRRLRQAATKPPSVTFSSSEATAARARRVVPTGTVALASRPSAASADAGWMSELIVGMNKGDHPQQVLRALLVHRRRHLLEPRHELVEIGIRRRRLVRVQPGARRAAPLAMPRQRAASAISCHGPMYSAPPPARGAAAAHAGSLEIERREDTVRDERHDAAEEATERLEVEVELTPLSEFCTT